MLAANLAALLVRLSDPVGVVDVGIGVVAIDDEVPARTNCFK